MISNIRFGRLVCNFVSEDKGGFLAVKSTDGSDWKKFPLIAPNTFDLFLEEKSGEIHVNAPLSGEMGATRFQAETFPQLKFVKEVLAQVTNGKPRSPEFSLQFYRNLDRLNRLLTDKLLTLAGSRMSEAERAENRIEPDIAKVYPAPPYAGVLVQDKQD